MLRLKIPALRIRIKKFDRRRLGRFLLFGLLIGSACLLGSVLGIYVAIRQNLPSISELETFEPNIITSVYAEDGRPVKEFAVERRIQVPYEKIPDVLVKAIIATEDPRFFTHRGVDVRGILRALKVDVLKFGGRPDRPHGGSTITQQLAKQLFLSPQLTIRRKLKEMLLSLQIEKQYSKEKILEIYCNQFYLGHGVYGVETASNLFFGKSVSDITLEEAALIAGIFRGPSVYSPYSNADLTLRRRNHVLNRMADEHLIPEAAAEEAKKRPMAVLPLHREDSDFGAYFFEEVRKHLEKNYGSDALYRAGLKVYTTLNPELQEYAEEALLKGLRVLDKKKGWRNDRRSVLADGSAAPEETWLPTWNVSTAEPGEFAEAIVLSVKRNEAQVRVKGYLGRLRNNDIEWTRTNNLEKLIKRGDVIQVRVVAVEESKKEILVSLEQEPLVEGAFLAVDNLTGQVKAMVGGYSFQRSKFNRATQALRQAGSAIKPFLYTAALENGFTPATVIVDEPAEFVDKWSGEVWSPPNYDGKFKGAVTVRKGLEESRNVVTAKLLDYISPQTGVDYCRKFGITSPIYPYISLALGTFEVTLWEIVSAYTAFPGKGIRVKPYFIQRVEDKEGNILEEGRVESEEVISPQVAYIMTDMLRGAISHGTAWPARALNYNLAGKTGTTDDFTDAWFVGFSPSLSAGVWVGNDTKVTLGNRQSGAVAALPVWIDFFSRVIEDKKKTVGGLEGEFILEQFEVPPNLSFVEIDRKTGLLATPACRFPLLEAFLPGSEPLRFCTNEDHMMILDYYGAEEEAKEEH